MSMFSLLLLVIGSACMLTDALGKPIQYITNIILELIITDYTNNVASNEHFLDNMYRIVSTVKLYWALYLILVSSFEKLMYTVSLNMKCFLLAVSSHFYI